MTIPTKTNGGYSGKIPVEGITALERASYGKRHGVFSLTLHVRDGRLQLFHVTSDETTLVEKAGK